MTKKSVQKLCFDILVYSYAYYILNQSLISDYEFDMKIKSLSQYKREWLKYPDTLTEDVIYTTSLHHLKAEDYPEEIRLNIKRYIR